MSVSDVSAASAQTVCTPLPVLGRDVQVPLVTGGEVTYAALDYAASAPALQRVWDDVAAYAPYYGSVHRGAGYLSQLSTDLFEQSRTVVADFLGCRPDDQVIFTRSTTDSLNLLASVIPDSTRVYVFETEHHASLLPWRDSDVTYLPAPRTPRQAVETLERALSCREPRSEKLSGYLRPDQRTRSGACDSKAEEGGDAGGTSQQRNCLGEHRRPTTTQEALVPGRGRPGRGIPTVSEGPALVCVTGASNVTGELWPVRELAAVARAHGARIVLDAAQLAPHHPVDIAALDVDYVAFSGHKLYAPFGSGVLAGRADWLCAAEPYLAGGGASKKVARHAGGGVDVEWHTSAARHEAGSPNVIGAYAIASACRALTEAGFDALVSRERKLVDRIMTGLARIPEVKVVSLFGDDSPRVGVISFVVDGWNSSHFAAALSAEYGIGVRDGLFCAHPLVRILLGSDPDEPGECGAPEAEPGERSLNAIRVSFGAGTPDEHVERFLGAVEELVRDGAKWNYRTEDGRCVPAS